MKWEEERLQTVVNKEGYFIGSFDSEKQPYGSSETEKKLLDEYDKSPVLVTEVQKLRDNFEEWQKNYQKYQEDLCAFIGNYMSATFEEIDDMSRKLDEIKWDFDGQLSRRRCKSILLKWNIYSDTNQVSSIEQPSSPITYHQFKSFLADGHNLQKQITDNKNLDEVIDWTGKTVRKIQEKVNELNSIKSIDTLEKMPKIIFGYVDYSKR
jgi:hypothetical protein